MPFESAVFLEMMPSTVTVQTLLTNSFYAVATYSTGVKHRARVVDRPGNVRGVDGQVVQYTSTIWLASTISPLDLPTARVITPGSSSKPVIKVERYPDNDGAHHYKMYLGH